MLNDAKTVLTDVKGNFEYEVMDAQNITYPDNYFDIVIANLMLYHIPNRKKAFSEITQVLKTDGTFYASTFGRNNMRELNDIFSDYYPQLKCSLDVLSNEFGLENGKSKLENYFEDIQVEKYPDHLEIDKAEPIINYVLSFGKNKAFLGDKKIESLRTYLNEEIESRGKITVTKDTGVFIAKISCEARLKFYWYDNLN